MTQVSRKIGLVIVIAADDMSVIVYTMDNYELALAQAKELFKGVEYPIKRLQEVMSNGMRQTFFRIDKIREVVCVKECEIAMEVLKIGETVN